MNLTDLRSTLEEHADFPDHDLPGRPTSVRGRVRVVRRRRRAALAGSLAAAVAVVAVGIGLPDRGEQDAVPVDRRFGDLTAPATMEALGYTYSFDRMVTGDGRVSVSQRIEGRPVLLTWANAGDGPVTVRDGLAGEPGPRPSVGGDFADYVVVEEPGLRGRLAVRGEGPVAIAVYELSRRPTGPSGGDVHFNADRPDERFVGGVVGEPGAAEVTVEFTMPEGEMSVASSCQDVPEGYQVSLLINDDYLGTGPCHLSDDLDGTGNRSTYRRSDHGGPIAEPGDRVTARMILVRRNDADAREPAPAPSGSWRLGLAVYELGERTVDVGGWALPERLRWAGHEWRHVTTTNSVDGARSAVVPAAVDRRPLLVVVGARASESGDDRRSFRTLVDGRERTRHLGGGFLSQETVLWQGSHVVGLALDRGSVAAGEMGVALYERVS